MEVLAVALENLESLNHKLENKSNMPLCIMYI